MVKELQNQERFLITGGIPLQGTVVIDGAKNSALSIMAACLLTSDKCILENVPQLKDVYSMIEVIKTLGVKVEWEDRNTLYIDSDDFNNFEAPYELVKTMRASFLVMGPLLARLKKAKISLPGGCAIGARPVDFHLKGFRALGADIVTEKGYIQAEEKNMKMFDKVTLILGEGEASFVDPHTVRVGSRTITGQRIFIAVGSLPMVPPIKGLADVEYLTNQNIFNLSEFPESMTIIGGGAIGCEMAQAFSRLGTKCTIVFIDGFDNILQFIRRIVGLTGLTSLFITIISVFNIHNA
jgi:hypothetical protein